MDKNINWKDFNLTKLQETICNWKKIIPDIYVRCSCEFALKTMNDGNEYPDFLGDCYNHVCEDAIEANVQSDLNQFKVDYENISKIMILYQEFIRRDFLERKKEYRVEYAYYVFTSPIVEWAQIGGLAILWGEILKDKQWEKAVKNARDIIVENNEDSEVAEKLIEYIQNRKRFMMGIGGREAIETKWQLEVADAIRTWIYENGKTDEYEMYRLIHRTERDIISEFCPDLLDMGFTKDPSEIFWVMCINPLISNLDKRFCSRTSWEKGIMKEYD